METVQWPICIRQSSHEFGTDFGCAMKPGNINIAYTNHSKTKEEQKETD